MSTSVIAAIFPDRDRAYEAAHELKQLEKKDVGFSANAGAMVGKDSKGNASLLDEKDRPLWGTATGTVIGGLVGLIGGPGGAVAGAALGGLTGMAGDAAGADIDADFVDTVTSDLNPGDTAVLVEAEEGSRSYVDDIVAKNGGRVHRIDA